MNQLRILTYSMDLALLNKYLEVVIQCLEPKIFDEKVEFLFVFFILQNKTLTFALNILGYIGCMVTFKYVFDRTKSGL